MLTNLNPGHGGSTASKTAQQPRKPRLSLTEVTAGPLELGFKPTTIYARSQSLTRELSSILLLNYELNIT